MKLGHTADEIKYDGTYDGTVSLYLVMLDNEPTMHIVCDSTDAEKIIRIGRPGCGVNGSVATAGRFTMSIELLEDADGGPLGTSEQVNARSVYTYVVPRIHVLLGRLLRAAA